MDPVIAAIVESLSPESLSLSVLGVFVGVLIGALPGLGSVVGITICLPFTYSMHPTPAIALLLGVYAGATYGGSISAVLINTHGTPQSAPTALEGYPMAQRGEAPVAIGWATITSVLGGLFSCVVLILAAPQLAAVAIKFTPVETFALIFLGLSCISTVSGKEKSKGLLSGFVGLMLATIGQDPISGDMRFTLDIYELSSGIDIIPVVVGAFALAEMLFRMSVIASGSEKINLVQCDGLRLPTRREWSGRVWTFFKSSLIGTWVGILPGTGATTAAFISYGEAQRSSKNRENFQKGEPDGIIATEASNNAVTGGALVPALALGIPGDPTTAIMLATLMLHGIVPGVRLMQENPVIVYSVFVTLIIANILMLPAGMIVTKFFSRILRIPEQLLIPMIIMLCLLGAYGGRTNPFDFTVTLAVGIIGLVFRAFHVPVAPMVIGVVLGGQFEFSMRQSLVLTDGKILPMLTEHPIAVFLFILTFILVFGGGIRRKLENISPRKN
jgi:putative tricarboxylic transport membrane protein